MHLILWFLLAVVIMIGYLVLRETPELYTSRIVLLESMIRNPPTLEDESAHRKFLNDALIASIPLEHQELFIRGVIEDIRCITREQLTDVNRLHLLISYKAKFVTDFWAVHLLSHQELAKLVSRSDGKICMSDDQFVQFMKRQVRIFAAQAILLNRFLTA